MNFIEENMSPKTPTGSLIPPDIRSLIIQRVRIFFETTSPPEQVEQTLRILTTLSPNNIRRNDSALVGGQRTLELNYSLPLSRMKFCQMIDVVRSSGIEINNWERLA